MEPKHPPSHLCAYCIEEEGTEQGIPCGAPVGGRPGLFSSERINMSVDMSVDRVAGSERPPMFATGLAVTKPLSMVCW